MPFKQNENEEGFLDLAFHPGLQRTANSSSTTRQSRRQRNRIFHGISRFRVKQDNPNEANPASEEVLLDIDEPYWNCHNGGTVLFGPDDYLILASATAGSSMTPT